MNTPSRIKHAVAIFAIASSILPSTSSAQEAPAGWKFSVMPYVWLPGIKADLKYGPPTGGSATANVNADESSVLMYLDLGKIDSKVKSVDFNPGSGPVNIATTQVGGNTESSFKGTIWTMLGGYTAINDPSMSLDLLAGIRYLGLEASSKWDLNAVVTLPNSTQTFSRTGSARKTTDVTVLIVGASSWVKATGSFPTTPISVVMARPIPGS